MANLYIIAGHGAGDSGACGHGFTEAERVRALAAEMAKLPGTVLLDTSVDWYQTGGISSLNIPAGDQLIELHLDSGPDSAHGGHVIIKSGTNPDNYDNALANYLGSKFPGRANLIVGRDDLANVNRAYNRGISYRLVEVCFITNYDDISRFNNDLADIAASIVSIFTGQQPQPQPQTEEEDDMVCIYKDSTGNFYYYNGQEIKLLYDQAQIDVMNDIYKKNHNDKSIPVFDWSNPNAPWDLRLRQVIGAETIPGIPRNNSVNLVDKFKEIADNLCSLFGKFKDMITNIKDKIKGD